MTSGSNHEEIFFFFLKFNSEALEACPAQEGRVELGDTFPTTVCSGCSQMTWPLAFGCQDTSQVTSRDTIGCTYDTKERLPAGDVSHLFLKAGV